MTGNAANADLWTDADVFIAPVGTVKPTTVSAAWAAAWKPVGLLNGEEGFTLSRDEDTAEHYAWGGLLIRKTRSKHKRTIKFVAMEDNEVTFDLVNPGSARTVDGASGLITSSIKVPKYGDFAVGFEMRDGNKVKRRFVSRATLEEIGEITESESDVAVYEITVVLFPTPDGTLYTELSGTVTP